MCAHLKLDGTEPCSSEQLNSWHRNGAMMSTHFLNSQVGSGSDAHCLSGSALTNATTSAGVTPENNRNTYAAVWDRGERRRVCVSGGSSYSCDLVIEKKNYTGPTHRYLYRRWWTSAAKQLIEGPPKAARLLLLSVDACVPECSIHVRF